MAEGTAGGPHTTDRRSRHESEIEFARIVAFSDGVMAIAITLLVLNLELPEVASEDRDSLAGAIVDLWPHFFAYVLSFAVIGRLWLVHHRFFSSLDDFDSRLMTANLVYLALIVLVPFSSDLLGTYGEIDVAVMVYAVTLGLAGLVNLLMIRYALRHDLVGERARRATEPFGARGALLIPGAFLASVPVALLSPVAAEAMWLLAFLAVKRQRRAGRG